MMKDSICKRREEKRRIVIIFVWINKKKTKKKPNGYNRVTEMETETETKTKNREYFTTKVSNEKVFSQRNNWGCIVGS